MKRLCIIPARGGSKRLSGKNVKLLAGKPLIFHTVDECLGLFDKIIITSDSENILETVKNEYSDYSHSNNTLLQIDKRPEQLASDTSKVIDTVSHYADQNDDFDQIWLCLPTCPLRTRDDIKKAQGLLTKELDGVISITEYSFPPSLGLLKGSRGNIVPYDSSDPWRTGNSRSQDHPTVWRPNGAIYGMWFDHFKKNRNFYKGEIKGYEMSAEKSVDIDTETDFKIAQALCE